MKKKRAAKPLKMKLLAKLLESTLREHRMNEELKQHMGGQALIEGYKLQLSNAQDQISQLHAQATVLMAEKKELEQKVEELSNNIGAPATEIAKSTESVA